MISKREQLPGDRKPWSLTAILKGIRRKLLDISLSAIFFGCVFLSVKASSDRFPSWMEETWLKDALVQFHTGNQIVFDLAMGIIVSLFIYVLVVRIPEIRKRARLRNNLRRCYSLLKAESITNFLFVLEGSADLDLVDRLKDREAFKNYFKVRIGEGQDRWDAVLNGIEEVHVRAIVSELAHFRRELEFTLASVDVDDSQAFALLRNLTRVLHSSAGWTTGYDEIKPLANFMWSLHTGWNWITGYTGRDAVADLIDAI